MEVSRFGHGWVHQKNVKELTDSTSGQTWGAFTPVMPAFIRLVAGVILLVVIQAVVLGFPGIQSNITGTPISMANIIVFFIGIIVSFIVLRFGTQLADAMADAYKNAKNWTTMISYLFQIIAIAILYYVTNGLAAPYFTSAPWAIPLIFLMIAMVPTIKLVVSLEHALEAQPGSNTRRPSQN